jgi:hypothetical protein
VPHEPGEEPRHLLQVMDKTEYLVLHLEGLGDQIAGTVFIHDAREESRAPLMQFEQSFA